MGCSLYIDICYIRSSSNILGLCVILLVLSHNADFVVATKSQDRRIQSKKFVHGFYSLIRTETYVVLL